MYDLRVRLIEADRCNNPATGQIDKDIKEGVERSCWTSDVLVQQQASACIRWNGKTNGTGWKPSGNEPAAERVASDGGAERPEQRRGVPILAPVIESLAFGTYTHAELMAAVVSLACLPCLSKYILSDPLWELQ
ncbi:phage portal protein [Paenibacillus larvae]|uniref:phage portal protein n=1 Tax=Paenibacillus larvae TaxID=1464 RepID=UPI00288EB0D9|nr:phage portal protein [Paenibacillus larvae]MDT2270064.1 phage portal protein [Paenibacillus larvae]